jgi:uncharacterized membrane protein HdeD (DUF308 family)
VFHGIASAVQLVGLAVIIFGALRIARAPSLAAGRSGQLADRPVDERERYARGLTDFYRISGAIAVVAGVLLLLVPIFAG